MSPLRPVTGDLLDCHAWLERQGGVTPEIVIDTLPGPELTIGGRPHVSFCSNNYLGLSRRPEVLAAGTAALARHSMGTCESRRLGGNLALLEALEERIARFKGIPAAMIFATGLLANVAAIPGLMDARWYCRRFHGMPGADEGEGAGGLILSDALNHRSIQMGIRLSRAASLTYRHGDLAHLEALLAAHPDARKLIVTDTVFSMDGDLAPLDGIVRLAARHHADVMVDDAHGTGVFGASGRGVAEHFAVEAGIAVHMGTLSKALGGMGGFVCARPEVVDFLKISASGYRFTSSLPAEQAAGLIQSLDLLEAEPWLRARLWKNVHELLRGMVDLGLPVPLRWSPIIPIRLGSEAQTREAERMLLDDGLLCVAVLPPLVAHGSARLRVSVNATHSTGHIEKLLKSLARIAKRMEVTKERVGGADWQGFYHNAPEYVRKMVEDESGGFQVDRGIRRDRA